MVLYLIPNLCFPGIFAFFPKLLLLLQLYLLGGIDVSWAEILVASLFKIIFPNVIDFPFQFVLKTHELNQIMNCITQIHNVKNTPIYFVVADSPVWSPAQLWVSAANPVTTQAPAAGLHSRVCGCVCVYTTSSSSHCCQPWTLSGGTNEDHNSLCSTADLPQHLPRTTWLWMLWNLVTWAEQTLCFSSPPDLELSHNSVRGALHHYTQGHSTFQGTLTCKWRSLHTEASSYSLEEVTAASSVQTAMQGSVQWKC